MGHIRSTTAAEALKKADKEFNRERMRLLSMYDETRAMLEAAEERASRAERRAEEFRRLLNAKKRAGAKAPQTWPFRLPHPPVGKPERSFFEGRERRMP
jgi:hypothetical protein